MIGRAFYSITASTDENVLCIFCQSTSDIHCYRDVKSIPWNITKSVSRAGFSNVPTPPLTLYKILMFTFFISIISVLFNVFFFFYVYFM